MNSSEIQFKTINWSEFEWINQPEEFYLEVDRLTIITDPGTDFWQRTHYGFQNDNGHAFIKNIEGDFTFSVKSDFKAENQYDQCGIIFYQDAENWVKASIEHENNDFARLGSVVTNLGFSDWASTDISPAVHSMWYRLSRRGQDFLLEHSPDGLHYLQMRMSHLHIPVSCARVGVYACSPLQSSFRALFSNVELEPCKWLDHQSETEKI